MVTNTQNQVATDTNRTPMAFVTDNSDVCLFVRQTTPSRKSIIITKSSYMGHKATNNFLLSRFGCYHYNYLPHPCLNCLPYTSHNLLVILQHFSLDSHFLSRHFFQDVIGLDTGSTVTLSKNISYSPFDFPEDPLVSGNDVRSSEDLYTEQKNDKKSHWKLPSASISSQREPNPFDGQLIDGD